MTTTSKLAAAIAAVAFSGTVHAATVLVGNGIEWSWSSSDVGQSSGQIVLHANVSGSELGDVWLQSFQLKKSDDGGDFDVGSASATGWTFSDEELSSNGCDGGAHDFSMCFYDPDSPLDNVNDNSDFDITIDFVFSSGVLSDVLHLKVNWAELCEPAGEGNCTDDGWMHVGSHISDDFTPTTDVPVPGTLGLLGMGLVALGAIRRKRVA